MSERVPEPPAPEREPLHRELPTPTSQKFVRYVVGFGVAVALGLAPYLGTLDVPGFSALSDLFPLTLRNRVASLAPVVMGVIAVVVQFGAGDVPAARKLRRRFLVTLSLLTFGFLVLVVAQTLLVEDVAVRGGEETVRYAVGFSRPTTCTCPAELSDAECIAQLSLDPARVETCWGSQAVELSELLLTFAYLLVIGSFGALVGLLVLMEGRGRADVASGAGGGAS